MKNHNLIKLLKSFSGSEIKEFEDFVNSPYFNNRSAVCSLFKILKKYYPDFESGDLTKEDLFRQIFPDKKYNDSTIRVILSGLNELAVKFVTFRNFENNTAGYNLSKINALLERNVLSGIERIISDSAVLLDKNEIDSIETFHYRHLYDVADFKTKVSRHSGVFDKFLNKTDLEKGFVNLMNYFYIRFLTFYINILNIQLIYNIEYDTEYIKEIFASLDLNEIKKEFKLEIYYCIVLMLRESLNENNYYKVKSIFLKNLNKFSIDAKKEILINLQNFCSRKISNGSEEFYNEKFELYKLELKCKTYLINNKISPVFFKTLVSISIYLKEYVWFKKFIEKYSKELKSEEKENILNYSFALYEFSLSDFDKAHEHLSKLRFTDLYQKLDSKVLQIMIYYEKDYEESLESSLEAFRHFLSNNKLIPEKRYQTYEIFLRSVKKLIRFKLSLKKESFEINKFLSETKSLYFVNKNWVLDKIKAL